LGFVDKDFMRQVWVLSEDARVQSRLSAAFLESRFHVKYRVQVARTLADVPDAHLADPGVSFFLDAFSSSSPGFDGLKKLRTRGFRGPVFLLGEPAPEDAAEPFLKEALTGFLPPIDRSDVFLAAGLVHAYHHFEGDIDLKWFLDTGGKAAVESIATIKDFNQLVLKLMNFVSRFGVNIQKLKRALVALSSSHVKNTPKGPTVIKPFKICYGIDSGKLILGVSLDAEELKGEKFLEDFGVTLSQVKGQAKVSASPRSDILNVAKITSNLVFLGGCARPQGSSTESFLLSTISFVKGATSQVEPYFFAYVNAQASEEMTAEAAKLEVVPPLGAAPAAAAPLVAKKKDLFEPSVMGDRPVDSQPSLAESPLSAYAEESFAPSHESTPSAHVAGADADPDLVKKLQTLQRDLDQHKRLSEALAADVKRLMKERREPLTSADLKESLVELNARLKHLQEQNKKLTEIKSQKESQIELLTAQVERLKMNAA
jgi:hypothetical protein